MVHQYCHQKELERYQKKYNFKKDLDELKGATNTQTTDEPPQEEESDVPLDEMKVENETNIKT